MLILPERYQPKLLMPVPEWEWREPSRAVPRDQLGNPVRRTRFVLRGRLNDGFVKWAGVFESRDDADAFLYSLARFVVSGTPIPREDWSLPTPAWHPDYGEGLSYDFATETTLTDAVGSNGTWNVPVDWNNADNFVDVIGGGGSGGGAGGGDAAAGGGAGGGGWSRKTNLTLSGTVTYQNGIGPSGTTGAAGTDGGDTWFDGTSLAGSSVAAKGGTGGGLGSAGTGSGGTGGASASGIGDTRRSGGSGVQGFVIGETSTLGGAGGGAGGPDANGGNGNSGGDGGDGNGGQPGGGNGGSQNNAGGNGSYYGSGIGPGGGAGRRQSANNGQAGGNYGGAGSGGARRSTGSNYAGGAGRQGMIFISYTPVAANGNFFMLF